MITIEQCRGARGLLGWTQQDLADASGLSKTAINNFEKKHSDIKTESLRAIRMAFESANIDFIGQEGVAKRTENFKILHGQNALNEMMNDMHLTMDGYKGEILISFVDQSLASRVTTQKLFKHIDVLKNNKIKERILCVEGSKHVLSPSDECRWISPDNSGFGTTSFIYGNKVAIEVWDKSMIIIISSQDASDAERARFENLWHKAQVPPQENADRNASANG